jgi:hypothetical protein
MRNSSGTEKDMVPELNSSIWEYSIGTPVIRRIV